jgi:hypothetical protein
MKHACSGVCPSEKQLISICRGTNRTAGLRSIEMFLNRRISPGERACGYQGLLIGQKRASRRSIVISPKPTSGPE